ncbi:hypothetical protein SDC9_108556 [bioreactor metagenome]|uniref:Uncharacterized protein n=1 Tax=bioreactor metagenome TaxID=1076179 RepID=A0A645B9H6_9ZZZZ
MQRFGGFLHGGFSGRNERGEDGDDEYRQGTGENGVQGQAGVDSARDQGHVIGQARKLGEVKADHTKNGIQANTKYLANDRSQKTEQDAFNDKEGPDLAWFHADGTQQTDLAGAFVNRHQQQI